MLILVTGGTGFVGSHVTRQLLAKGHNVRILVRSLDKASQFYQQFDQGRPELCQGDVTDAASISKALDGCDALVHAAAGTPISVPSKEQLFAVNIGGTKNVIGAAVDKGLKSIVYISSVTAIFNTDASRVTADAPVAPSNMPYGQSKVAAEEYVRSLQDQGAPIATVYPGGIIGPDDPGFSDAFKALHHRINNGFRIFGDGGMQHVDVRDLAEFIVSLLEDGGAGRFLLPGPYCRWKELADIIDRVSGARLERIPASGWKLRLIGRLLDVVRHFKKMDTPISAEMMRYATLWPMIDNTEELARRGIVLRTTEETFTDSLRWMLSAGYLKPEQVPNLI
jgi:dihydroflavonol-4-reductase